MTNQRRFFSRPRLWGLLCGLTLAVAQFFSPAGASTAQAATITISDAASCQAFGGALDSFSPNYCTKQTVTIAASDTLIFQMPFVVNNLTNNGTVTNGPGSANLFISNLTNNVGATIDNYRALLIQDSGVNYGNINLFADNLLILRPFTNASTGRITLRRGTYLSLSGELVNEGTILLDCGVPIIGSGTVSGNPVQYPNDCNAPTANPTQSPAANANGWTDNDVTVNWNWSDNAGGSGLDLTQCTTRSTSSGEGVQTLTATCLDKTGNVGSASYTVKIDKTPPLANPAQSPAANANGWTISQNVAVNWNWTDNGGIDAANCTTSSNSGTDLGVITFEASCSDLAGNSGTASYMLKIDPFAPLISRTRNPGPNTQGWNNRAVTVSFGCNDGNFSSGVASNTLAGATLSNEGANQSVTNTGSCVDNAGNVATPATVSPINIDLTKPTISAAATTAPNANGWYNHNVTIHYTCTDALSGVAACPSDQGLSSEGTAVASLALFSRDDADNLSEPSNVVTVNIDKTAPSVLVTGVTNGTVYDFGSVPTAACSTSDALSGVATQATLSLTGGNGDGTGSFTATCSGASDVADNSAAPVSVSYTIDPPADSSAPVITPNVVGTLGNNGWYTSDVVLSWMVVDAESAISNQDGCEAQNVISDTAGVTFTCSATSAGGSNSQSVTIKRDATAPTISAAASSGPNGNGWYNSNVTVQFTCADALSGIATCPADQSLSSEGSAVTSTAQMVADQAGNSSAASNIVTVQLDKTAPVVTVTGVSNGANYTLGSVPAAGCSTTDALSGVATQATLSLTGGNGDGTGSFIAICSGATDNAGNSGSASVSYTVTTVVSDACTTTALRDNFNRANGSLGSNWVGLTGQSFYKLAGNQVDVQLGGPVLWKPTTFGVNQAAFVTLSTLDATGPAQGLLLKVQGGTIPTGGAIAVVYDSLAKAVRVSTLRLNTPAWTVYGHTPATFANGDQLLGCVQANGTVRVYRNSTLLTTVTLNAADQSFFNAKGGKIGLWTVAALNAVFDDFGGGALTGVTGATLDATVPAEVADDGADITVAEDFPTDDTAAAPDAAALVNRLFLPLVNR